MIDLWASVKGLSLREAALDLVRTFGLEPASSQRNREEERLRTVDGVTSRNPASRRGRPPCAATTLEQPFLPPVITETRR